MKPKLISFNLCPFVQRAAIVLAHKNIEHDVEYIDLADLPDWFVSISPLKKVPVLTIDDHVIFDSSVISEFLDEAYPGRLHPEDVFLRAMNRSWIEFGNQCTFDAHYMSVSKTEDELQQTLAKLWSNFDLLEKVVQAEPYFNGSEFSLVDSAYAPMFQRLDFIEAIYPGVYDSNRHMKIIKWKNHLLQEDSVQQSAINNLQDVFHDFLYKQESYIASLL